MSTTNDSFVIQNSETLRCIDIYRSDAKVQIPVKVYFHIHYGCNQLWFFENEQITSSLNTNLCLGVEKEIIRLVERNHTASKWTVEGKLLLPYLININNKKFHNLYR
jgi:hypothetical protein